MTQKEFWQALSEVVADKNFERVKSCHMVRWSRKRIQYMLFCPLTAVYYKKFGKKLKSSLFREAGEKLELKLGFINDLQRAADYTLLGKVGTKMAKVVGLP